MILSFILFIGAVLFVLFFFRPSSSLDLVGSSSDFVFAQVEERVETDVVRYGLQIVAPTLLVGLRLDTVPEGAGSRAVTERGLTVESGISGSLVSAQNPGVSFMTIEVSDAFPPGILSGVGDEAAVVISSSIAERVLSEKKLLLLNGTYHAGYETLKQDLQISPGLNFRFLTIFAGGDRVEGERDVPVGVEVFVKEQRREVIRLDGRREFASLVVSIW